MNQCDGCRAHAPTRTKDGVTYHEMASVVAPSGTGQLRHTDLMICQAAKYADPADFASLLEREPLEMGDVGMLEEVTRQRDNHRKTNEPMAARIKELEGVLVAIRSRAVEGTKMLANAEATAAMRKAKLDGIASLVSETLDPCKSWCSGPEDHEGACPPREYPAREDE